MIVGKILEQGNDWNVKWDMLNHNTGNPGPFFCKALERDEVQFCMKNGKCTPMNIIER
jgi:hypothetical protein